MNVKLFLLACITTALGIILDYYDIMDREFGEPLYRLSLSILVPLFILLFTRKSVFDHWFTFARVWIPLSTLLILISPASSGAWVSLYPLTKEVMTVLMGTLFVLISLYRIVRYVLKNQEVFVPSNTDH